MGIRSFTPQVTACPGCGRTTSTFFQEMAEQIQTYLREQMPSWKGRYIGVEEMKLAVMGCVVNGPGESKHANIGISLPGTFEEPKAPVYVDGRLFTTLKGDRIVAEFIEILDEYVDSHYAAREAGVEEPVREIAAPRFTLLCRDVDRNVFSHHRSDAGGINVASYVSTVDFAGLFLPENYCPVSRKMGVCGGASGTAEPESLKKATSALVKLHESGWRQPRRKHRQRRPIQIVPSPLESFVSPRLKFSPATKLFAAWK